MLATKSLTELRGIAQSLEIADVFQKDKIHLLQEIELKHKSFAPVPKIEIPKPEYDARLMLRPPSKKSSQQEIKELLVPYIARGLQLSFTEEQWFMRLHKKTDEGTIRMPLQHVLRCADKMMR